MNKPGDLRVWWVPQVPGMAFHVPVKDVAEGVKIMDTLANYDLFQFKNNIKPDYCNAGGLDIYEEGEAGMEWVSWYDEATSEEDPRVFLEDQHQ